MTRAKAAQICQAIKFILGREDYSEEVEEALNMAIAALKQLSLPKIIIRQGEQEPCEYKRTDKRTETHACDCISRQAAINDIEKNAYRHTYLEQIIDIVSALPSAQQWIPCSERLPRINGVYNVTRKISDGFECRNISDACYYDGANTWHDDTRVNHERMYLTDVIAWMPRPKPYKGEES